VTGADKALLKRFCSATWNVFCWATELDGGRISLSA